VPASITTARASARCSGASAIPTNWSAFARASEAIGLDEIWIVEDCFWAGGLTAVAASLAVTEHLHVGMGIAPAVARNAAITAMEMSGLSRMFPGRFVAGFGHGVASWMRQIGALPPSQLAALDETVDVVRRLLDGEHVSTSLAGTCSSTTCSWCSRRRCGRRSWWGSPDRRGST
jgi:alkanesulfonate monooxygenase SsuD/methylene tetrahydromethanopterin reductase-like flavin-dependent oxidoreductase (luciferase family)